MGWTDLLQEKTVNQVTLPWFRDKTLWGRDQSWAIIGKLPPEAGWYVWSTYGRKASCLRPGAPQALENTQTGYLVGDHFVSDSARVDPDPTTIHRASEKTFFVEEGLDLFTRVSVGRLFEDSPLLYSSIAMPLGPEEETLQAFLDQRPNLNHLKGVTPALDAAFRIEFWRREQAEKRRLELERLRREEEARLALEERRRHAYEKLGDAVGRREMAQLDFGEAARAALTLGGAQYLDHRKSARKGEMVVRYRVLGQRLECTCDIETLRIVDAGICLTDHDTGERGDSWLTLESLPSVVMEAQDEGKLVIFRHV